MSVCVGVLGFVAAAIDLVAVATGGKIGTGLVMFILASSLGVTFTSRGVRKLRQAD